MDIHRTAARGFSASVDAYERGRPSYPVELVDVLARDVGVAGARVIELGAGTGKLTRMIAPIARSVVALEPVVEMREALSRSLAAAFDGDAVSRTPRVRVVQGVAEEIPIETASF